MPQISIEERDLVRAIERANQTGRRQGRDDAFTRVLLSAASRTLAAEVEDVAGLVSTVGTRETMRLLPGTAREVWPSRWQENLDPILQDIAVAATESRSVASGGILPRFDATNPRMADWFAGYTSELAGTLSATSYENALGVIREGIDEGLSGPNIAAKLRKELPELSRVRADLISRTESHNASEGSSFLQARESGVVKAKVWESAGDSRVRPEHVELEGEQVGIDEPFSNGLDMPSEPACRCTLTYVLTDEFGGRS